MPKTYKYKVFFIKTMRWWEEQEKYRGMIRGKKMIELVEVKSEHREFLWNVLQKYLYEMTNYYDDKLPVGFAMLNPYSYINEQPDHVLGEFTIFPMYRKKHIGKYAAELILKTFRGQWEIKYNEKNVGAKALWTKITGSYHPVKHRYSKDETVLSFLS